MGPTTGKEMIVYVATGPTGKQYVGQTIQTLGKRKTEHESTARLFRSIYFHRALRKHGRKNFTWDILEECLTMEDLNEREIFWIEKLNSQSPNGYNLNGGGKNFLCSESTKKKISDAVKGKNHARYGLKGRDNPLFGTHHSEETREKMRKSHKGKHEGEKTACLEFLYAVNEMVCLVSSIQKSLERR